MISDYIVIIVVTVGWNFEENGSFLINNFNGD